MSRFDVYRKKRRLQALPQWGQSALVAAGAIVLFTFAFQVFFRYQYVTTNGTVWRIDRLSHQSCRMEGADCVEPSKPKFSTSTSTSTSTSISLDTKTPKKH